MLQVYANLLATGRRACVQYIDVTHTTRGIDTEGRVRVRDCVYNPLTLQIIF